MNFKVGHFYTDSIGKYLVLYKNNIFVLIMNKMYFNRKYETKPNELECVLITHPLDKKPICSK